MIKKLLLGAALLTSSAASQAGFIHDITGADMAGIEVTALFGDGTSETKVWAANGADSGEATGTGWTLSQSGITYGQQDNITDPANPVVLGAWSLVNESITAGIIGLSINASIADIYFDVLGYVEHTPGSSFGRDFYEENNLATAAYADELSSPDLFGTMNITYNQALLAKSSSRFVSDTDKAIVSEPATALVFLSGLLALVNLRRKS